MLVKSSQLWSKLIKLGQTCLKLVLFGVGHYKQSIARYLAGLRFEISKTVQLQPYNTLQDVLKLALKVEALNKYGGFTTNRIKE